jgi:hypothetical protein
MAFRKSCLDGRLASQQLVQRSVAFVLVDAAEIEDFAQAEGCRGRREGACCGEIGDWLEDAPDYEGDDEVARRAKYAVEAALVQCARSAGITVPPRSTPRSALIYMAR